MEDVSRMTLYLTWISQIKQNQTQINLPLFWFLAQTVSTTQRCWESALCWTAGLQPAVYRSNYTLLDTRPPAQLTVLVCLAPGNSFHLWNDCVGGRSISHTSVLAVDVHTVRGCACFPQHSEVSYKGSQCLQENTAAGCSLCGDAPQQTSALRGSEGCGAVFTQHVRL